MRYKHTQIGYLIIFVLFAATVFVAITGIAAPSDRGVLVIDGIIELILLICAIVFSKLTIKVGEATLHACFGIGLICKKVPLSEILGCESIRIRWWYGWGIHLTPYGWLYNVSGLDAVATCCVMDENLHWERTILTASPRLSGVRPTPDNVWTVSGLPVSSRC